MLIFANPWNHDLFISWYLLISSNNFFKCFLLCFLKKNFFIKKNLNWISLLDLGKDFVLYFFPAKIAENIKKRNDNFGNEKGIKLITLFFFKAKSQNSL